MVLVVLVGYSLVYSISIVLGLSLGNSFDTWEVSLVEVSLGTLAGLMICTGELYLVGL